MKQAPLYEIYREALGRTPHKLAVICDENRQTFTEYDFSVRAYARALRHLGVLPGDRVGFVTFGCLEITALYLACFRLGAVAVPIGSDCSRHEIARSANLCGIKVLLAGAEFVAALEGVEPEIPSLSRPVFALESESWRALLETARQAGVSDAPAEFDPHAPAVIWCTSGSTGTPKGVTYSQHALSEQLRNRVATLEHSANDVAQTALQLSHCAAPTGTLFTMLAVGGTAVFTRRFEIARCFSAIAEYRPTHFTSVPYVVKAMLQDPAVAKVDFSCFRFFSAGGDQVTAELQQEFRQATGLSLIPIMGMTECSGYLTTVPPLPLKPGKVGKPFHGTEVSLRTEEGTLAKTGEVGELCIRTEGRMLGYWQSPELTAEVIRDGWMHTGDLAVEDEDGYFEFVGRIKNIIIRMGGNITPGEVERVFNQHPKVKESGVAGVADALVGEIVVALVVPSDPTLTAEELREFCRGILANRKIPERIFFVDKLPRNAMGKLQRKELAALAQSQASASALR